MAEKTGVWDLPRAMIKTSTVRDSRNGDDCLQVLEQEAFIEGSARLRGLETTLNRMVSVFVYGILGYVFE